MVTKPRPPVHRCVICKELVEDGRCTNGLAHVRYSPYLIWKEATDGS